MNIHAQLTQYVINSGVVVYDHELIIKISGYGLLIALSSSVVYYLYIRRIFARKIPPSIVTWSLWLLLDMVAVISSFKQGHFNVQLITYTFGTALVCLALLIRKNLSWDKLWDSITAAIVVLSVVVYILVDNSFWALTTALTGMTFAAIPMFCDLINEEKEPWMEPWDSWLVIFMGSVLTCLDGQLFSGAWLGLLQFIFLSIILQWNFKRRFVI